MQKKRKKKSKKKRRGDRERGGQSTASDSTEGEHGYFGRGMETGNVAPTHFIGGEGAAPSPPPAGPSRTLLPFARNAATSGMHKPVFLANLTFSAGHDDRYRARVPDKPT